MALYSPLTDPKYQPSEIPETPVSEHGVIISEDTRRMNRLPPGQHRTRKWPVLHASSVPRIDSEHWRLRIDGLVRTPLEYSLSQFRELPRVRVFADFHCVTTWSRLANRWQGVSVAAILQLAGIQPDARYAVIGGYDNGWTTNLPLDALMQQDVLLADIHDGSPIDADHGGPVRLVVPRLFAWKSAKWVHRIELTADNRPGYWEQAGYHDVGDPWQEQRFRDQGLHENQFDNDSSRGSKAP